MKEQNYFFWLKNVKLFWFYTSRNNFISNLTLPVFVESYPDVSEEVLRGYISTFYPKIYKVLFIINKDLDISFKLLLSEALQWIHNMGDNLEESIKNSEEYLWLYLSENSEYINMEISDLTATILLYKNYRKVYDYMIINKSVRLSKIYNDILKDYPEYPLIFNWVYIMLYTKNYLELITSDNLEPNTVKDILKIVKEEECD